MAKNNIRQFHEVKQLVAEKLVEKQKGGEKGQ